MATVIRLLMLIRWILMLPAVMLGFWISRVERTRQLPGRQQWLPTSTIAATPSAVTDTAARRARAGVASGGRPSLATNRLRSDRNAGTGPRG